MCCLPIIICETTREFVYSNKIQIFSFSYLFALNIKFVIMVTDIILQ